MNISGKLEIGSSRTFADSVLRAIMEINPDFLEIAAALDLERSQGHVRGPLHGIPFLVKDNIGSKDRMETTAGSWMLRIRHSTGCSRCASSERIWSTSDGTFHTERMG